MHQWGGDHATGKHEPVESLDRNQRRCHQDIQIAGRIGQAGETKPNIDRFGAQHPSDGQRQHAQRNRDPSQCVDSLYLPEHRWAVHPPVQFPRNTHDHGAQAVHLVIVGKELKLDDVVTSVPNILRGNKQMWLVQTA